MAAAASPADNYVCDYEPSPSYLELFQAYYNLTIELSTGKTRFISISEHVRLGNGRIFTLKDYGIIFICIICIVGLKCAHDHNFDRASYSKQIFNLAACFTRVSSSCDSSGPFWIIGRGHD